MTQDARLRDLDSPRPRIVERPGDVQPARRLVHIANYYADQPAPTHFLCGVRIVQIVKHIGTANARGGGVCPACVALDKALDEAE